MFDVLFESELIVWDENGIPTPLIDFIPDSWLPYVLTERDAISLGYIVDNEVVPGEGV